MKSFLMITALIITSLLSFAREIDGVIITDGKARDVTFIIKVPLLANEPNFERIQFKVKYYDGSGKKKTLRPDDADEIRFNYYGMEVRMISCFNTIGAGSLLMKAQKIFLKLEIDGPLRLYRYYYRQTNPGYYGGAGGYSPETSYVVDNLIFQKGDGPLKQPRALGWRKDMLEYFTDCPALRERIESKELRRKEIEAIVMYYNQHCGRR
ncbi:hypothetical protein [Chryseosolibacter indicus]|uniref:DUF4468 domain-containing protein n=1 Tax=Chryseosolibacter indicus TaxID=2782351 RepID=A0ABS5VUM4_9BACT|nr:hypothetical protein [Chryseosolibacter indicus]MBT1705123.1 hypothetical protein [Chryseosolibacter indicus]